MAVSGLGVTLLSQGFNDLTIPAGWATEIVNDPAIDPALAYVTTSANPAGFAPYEGTRFVQFNSYVCPSGAVIRLKYTNGFSTIGYAVLKVQCAWTEDNEYAANPDFVTLQWSTDGTAWNSFTNYYRYNAAGKAWSPKTIDLPAGALNQPNVMLAFAFNSRYGNDCHLDDVQVNDQAPNVYVLPAIQGRPGLPGDVLAYVVTVTNLTGASTAFNLFYRNANWSESGPAITPTLSAGAATSFVVNATVPLAGLPSAVNTAIVVAIQGSYSNSAVLASQCTWSKTIMNEPFTTYASTNGWASYFLASPQLGWFWSTASGNPQPSLRHGDVTVTGIVSNWIVTPAIALPNANQIQFSCDFIPFVTAPRTYYYTGAFISKGNRNPASNDYVEIAPCPGVPARIIRYYIARGLLDGPGKGGRRSSYSAAHRARLRQIQALQDQGRTLAEIHAAGTENQSGRAPLASATWLHHKLADGVVLALRSDVAPWQAHVVTQYMNELARALRSQDAATS